VGQEKHEWLLEALVIGDQLLHVVVCFEECRKSVNNFDEVMKIICSLRPYFLR